MRSVRKQVSSQVWDRVSYITWEQTKGLVWFRGGYHVRDRVVDQVETQVRDKIMEQVWEEEDNEIS